MNYRVIFLNFVIASIALGASAMTPEEIKEIERQEATLRRGIDEKLFVQKVNSVIKDIQSFYGYDLTTIKFWEKWVYQHWPSHTFSVGDWFVDMGEGEVAFKAYFDEVSKVVNSKGEGVAVEVTLRFSAQVRVETGKLTLEFLGFAFERGLERVGLRPLTLPRSVQGQP